MSAIEKQMGLKRHEEQKNKQMAYYKSIWLNYL